MTDPIQPIAQQLAEARDGWHYANGVAELAMKHRDEAEAKVAELERQRDALRADVAARDSRIEDLEAKVELARMLMDGKLRSALAATQPQAAKS